jgi:hypothetical protein
MMGNYHVRFLGGLGAVNAPRLPGLRHEVAYSRLFNGVGGPLEPSVPSLRSKESMRALVHPARVWSLSEMRRSIPRDAGQKP